MPTLPPAIYRPTFRANPRLLHAVLDLRRRYADLYDLPLDRFRALTPAALAIGIRDGDFRHITPELIDALVLAHEARTLGHTVAAPTAPHLTIYTGDTPHQAHATPTPPPPSRRPPRPHKPLADTPASIRPTRKPATTLRPATPAPPPPVQRPAAPRPETATPAKAATHAKASTQTTRRPILIPPAAPAPYIHPLAGIPDPPADLIATKQAAALVGISPRLFAYVVKRRVVPLNIYTQVRDCNGNLRFLFSQSEVIRALPLFEARPRHHYKNQPAPDGPKP